jgi:hypothetical protein
MADLQELFARLNGQSSAAGSPGGGHSSNYRQPSISSPIFSPSPSGPRPQHPSAVMSPALSALNTPEQGGPTPQQQSAQLLNLLRFNSQPTASQQSIPPHRRPPHNNPLGLEINGTHARQVTASDLVPSFMGKAASPAPPTSASAMSARSEQPSVSSENPQDFLLRLLNHPKPSQTNDAPRAVSLASSASTKAPETAVEDVEQNLADADAELEKAPSDSHASATVASPMRVFGSDGGAQSRFEPAPAAVAPKFTYVNPFDKLEAASPRNRTPAPVSSSPALRMETPKHTLDGSSTGRSEGDDQHTSKSRKLTTLPVAQPHETVAEAVSDLGEQVDQQVEAALAKAEAQSETDTVKAMERLAAETVADVQEAVFDTAVELKKELEDEDVAQALDEELGEPVAQVLKDAVAEVADSWESAEAEDSASKDEEQTVIVYRFPMRAFSSIAVQNMPQRRATFRPELFMDIARLKKEFDQIDRSLVSASKNFIVYALVKKGGFRIIQQDNGLYRQVFENHHERIFNIALCTSGEGSSDALESILGIGVNGSVFWTSLEAGREDHFNENLDTQGIVLPPSPSQDDNNSGGQLKTRAKPSSRHPDFFAVGRGKSIHIIWPKVAAEYVRGGKGIVQTEKYLKERSLKILTGKAGKDFSFSADDTVIVSLDKAGRMRFWDIRPLIDSDLGFPRSSPQQIEVSDTLLEFYTTSPNAKSWPTSVFFFDKDKPVNKGIALRYVMVGMKQNHSFQLWDLGLGKAVQEIHLPHEKESDAICSVSFHPRTGIMAVAHPTRNSIFFIHVSCPKYNLPTLNQATYISRLINKAEQGQNPLPNVTATAIMTSIAEYSFASKGQIRSLYMLNEPAGPPDVDDPENTALFELYVMHSKGVCTLRIRRSDLGWKREGEPINPREAQEEGIITISVLPPPQPVPDESSTSGDTPAPKSISDRSARESIKRENSHVSKQSMTPEAAMRASTLAKVESKQDAVRAAIINGSETPQKKKKKRSTVDTASHVSSAPRSTVPSSYAQAAQAVQAPQAPPVPKSPVPTEPSTTETVSSNKSSDTDAPAWAKKLISQHLKQSNAPAAAPAAAFDPKKIQEVVESEITKGFSRELDVLYKRLDEDKRVMNATNGAKQEAILRLVSATLTENVEGVIRKMVEENMRNMLLPNVLQQVSSTVEKSVSNNLKAVLGTQLAKEVPEAVSKAIKSPQLFQSLSESVAKKVTTSIEPIVVASTGSVLNPAMGRLSQVVEQQIGDQLRQDQAQRIDDAAKIAQLTDTVQTLIETIQSMATAQAGLQDQLMKLQQFVSQPPPVPGSAGLSSPQVAPSPAQIQHKTPEQLEAESIHRLMTEGNYEQGTMRWLQSNRTSELFNSVFVKCNPAYLSQVSPLLNLSTGAVVTDALEHNLPERLVWLDAVLKNVDPNVSHISSSLDHANLTTGP